MSSDEFSAELGEFVDLGLPSTGGLPPRGDFNFQDPFLMSLEGTAAAPAFPGVDIDAVTFTQCERDSIIFDIVARGIAPVDNPEFDAELAAAESRREECTMSDQFGPAFGDTSGDAGLIIPTFQQTDQPFILNPPTSTPTTVIGFDPGFDPSFPDIEPTSGPGGGTSGQDDPFFDDTTFLGNIGAILLEGASAIINAVANVPANIIVLAAQVLGRQLSTAEAQALQAAFSQDPQRIAASLAQLAQERASLVETGTAPTTTTGGMTMPTDPFSTLIQGIAGCDERFFRPAPERIRAVPLLCVPRPDGGSEFYINIKLNRSKLIRMEASRGRRRSKR